VNDKHSHTPRAKGTISLTNGYLFQLIKVIERFVFQACLCQVCYYVGCTLRGTLTAKFLTQSIVILKKLALMLWVVKDFVQFFNQVSLIQIPLYQLFDNWFVKNDVHQTDIFHLGEIAGYEIG